MCVTLHKLEPGEHLVEVRKKDYRRIFFKEFPDHIGEYNTYEHCKFMVDLILVKWCRLNCQGKFRKVILWQPTVSKVGYTFSKSSDAVRFKLTWGGK